MKMLKFHTKIEWIFCWRVGFGRSSLISMLIKGAGAREDGTESIISSNLSMSASLGSCWFLGGPLLRKRNDRILNSENCFGAVFLGFNPAKKQFAVFDEDRHSRILVFLCWSCSPSVNEVLMIWQFGGQKNEELLIDRADKEQFDFFPSFPYDLIQASKAKNEKSFILQDDLSCTVYAISKYLSMYTWMLSSRNRVRKMAWFVALPNKMSASLICDGQNICLFVPTSDYHLNRFLSKNTLELSALCSLFCANSFDLERH